MMRKTIVFPGLARDRWPHHSEAAPETQRSRIKSGTTWGSVQ
jgi:hypothetical protein